MSRRAAFTLYVRLRSATEARTLATNARTNARIRTPTPVQRGATQLNAYHIGFELRNSLAVLLHEWPSHLPGPWRTRLRRLYEEALEWFIPSFHPDQVLTTLSGHPDHPGRPGRRPEQRL